MLIDLNQKKGQSTLEYAVLVTIIIGALLSMQFYLKRGIAGKVKDSADQIGDQYSAGNTNVLESTTTKSKSTESFATGKSTTKLTSELTNTTKKSVIVNADKESF